MSRGHLGISVLAIFVVTALLSMWISNTATAAMMLPLALGLLSHLDVSKDRKTLSLSCSALPIRPVLADWAPWSVPPNAIAAKALGYDFADWMKIGLPMMFIILPAMLVSLYLVLRPKLNHKIQFATEDIPWTRTRIATMILFLCTAIAWIFSKNSLKFWYFPAGYLDCNFGCLYGGDSGYRKLETDCRKY